MCSSEDRNEKSWSTMVSFGSQLYSNMLIRISKVVSFCSLTISFGMYFDMSTFKLRRPRIAICSTSSNYICF